MSRIKKRELGVGIVLMVSFVAVMVTIFMPLFDGGNALNYLDNLYNTISKGSAYYIPKVGHEVEAMDAEVQPLLEAAGASVAAAGDTLTVTGDLKSIFASCLADAEAAYHNRGSELEGRYGSGARPVLHSWWRALSAMEKDLNRQKLFALAQLTHTVQAKAVECAYNYYGIEAQQIKDRWGTVLFSLVFYVVYTVWYGYAIMFLFEGLGFELTAH